ncbi:MAG: OmpA family protein, partial [Flavobacteriales bacterium]
MKNLLAIILLVSSSVLAQDAVQLSVHFDKESDVPYMPEMAMLNEIAYHPNSKQLRFAVVGHTDANGSANYNQELSKKRTTTVVNHLLMSGVKPYNIVFDYMGERGAVQEETEECLAESRRVDILISNVGDLDKEGFAGLYSEDSFLRPLPNVNPDEEVFEINTLVSNCIETASGTLIEIPPMAFMDAYGRPISGEVEVSYLEYNDPFSIFLSGITMKYDENGEAENLESAGMFSLLATQRNRPVELRPDKNVSMDFVSTSQEDNYDFFFLDPNENAWDKLGEAPIREDDSELIEQVENMSQAVLRYLGSTDYLSPTTRDRTTLEEHFQNLDYMNGRPIASYYRFLRKGNERESKQFKRVWRKGAGFKARLLPQSRKNDEATVHFKIDRRIVASTNSEWRRFSAHTWEYDGDL